ncbi:helix-turn-helix transcriptional regulator [Brachybacterium hainanense]|uniref:LuxR C-terminal-related transcriptional regulator n=1 Tax=Brachybacterium hainanense TaxID=1541174 RepID=A0ABV6RB85_9MICO
MDEGQVGGAAGRDLRQELRRLRGGNDLDALATFLDRSYYRAMLAEPELLAEVLESPACARIPAHSRHALTLALTRHSLPLPDVVITRFERWVAAQPHPELRDRLGVRSIRLHRMLFEGSYGPADQLADELLAELSTSTDRVGIQDVIPIVLMNVGTTKLLGGRAAEAIGALRGAMRWAEANGGHPAAGHAQTFIGLVHVLAADLERAEQILPDPVADPHGPEGGRLRMWSGIAVLTRGLLHVARGEHEQAREELARAGQLDPETDEDLFGQYWWLPVHVRSRLDLHEDPAAGVLHLRRQLEDHYSSARPDAYPGALLRADLADLLQAAGALDEAGQVLDEAESAEPEDAHVAHRPPQLVASRARLLWLLHETAALETLLGTIGRFSALSSPELDVIRLLRQRTGTAGWTLREGDPLCAAIRGRGPAAELALLPAALREQLFGADPVPQLSSPYPRTEVVVLTRGERELLGSLEEGDSIADAARRLHVSPHTVKTRLRDMYRKAGVHSKAELLRKRAVLLGGARRAEPGSPPAS